MFRYQKIYENVLLKFGILYTRINLPIYQINILNSQRIKISSRVEVQLLTDVYFKFKLKGKLYKD